MHSTPVRGNIMRNRMENSFITQKIFSIKYRIHATAFELRKCVLNRKIELLFLLRQLFFFQIQISISPVNYLLEKIELIFFF